MKVQNKLECMLIKSISILYIHHKEEHFQLNKFNVT